MAETESAAKARQTRLFLIIFVALMACLGAGYFMFLRPQYVVLYSDLRANEAATVVTELDRQGVSYRLERGGSAILVPAADADKLRIGLAGADLPTNGEVGFELFNESSMGLTDFAQKINYQRALQGELSRTIMAIEGVEAARVHLALPERVLFRGARNEPRAAVTVIPKRGSLLDEPRVLGIQRLVASAVPELSLDNVIVLDGFGRIISPAAAAAAEVPPELVQAHAQYQEKIRSAVMRAVPDLQFEVELALSPTSAPADASLPQLSASGFRTYTVRAAIVTASPVPADEQAKIIGAIRTDVALDESAGDRLMFRAALPAPADPQNLGDPSVAAAPAQLPAPEAKGWLWSFLAENWASLLAMLGIAAILVMGRMRAAVAARDERAELVGRIRAQLALEGQIHG